MSISENNLKNKRAAFLSLGCKTNAYETEAIKQQFKMYGAEICEFTDYADIYVINTCTVTNIADKKSRQMLRRARSLNPQAVVLATGCYVQESADSLKEDGTVDLLIGNRLKSRIAEYVNDYLQNPAKEIFTAFNSDQSSYEEMSLLSEYRHTRADIKIQDGCNQFCSYCIIPYARGRISSRNKREVISEVSRLAERGYKEAVLTGIHLSSYGLDDASAQEQASLRLSSGRMPLIELLEELNSVEGLERIRLGSLEPRIITEDFVRKMSCLEKVCPHFHLSLQSGSDSVLKRMNRKYTTEEYLNACGILRKYYYRPSVTTDIIVGFPGETEIEFEETVSFAEKAAFAAIHIFPYSRRFGTAADRMEMQLTASEKQERAKRMAETEKRLRNSYEVSFSGDIKPVLVEECRNTDGKSLCIGFTPEYVPVCFEGDSGLVNTIVDVKMSDMYVNEYISADFDWKI